MTWMQWCALWCLIVLFFMAGFGAGQFLQETQNHALIKALTDRVETLEVNTE